MDFENSCRNREQKFIEALQMVQNKMRRAIEKKGFAISGALIQNSTGQLVYATRNRCSKILDSGQISSSNSLWHAEQQAIIWYWQNKKRLNLPDPNQMTIITSLDPCIMCTGYILMSGFNVGTIAFDSTGGINWRMKQNFDDFKQFKKVYQGLTERFGYYKIYGSSQIRKNYIGSSSVFGNQFGLQKSYHQRLNKIFQACYSISPYMRQIYPNLVTLKDISQLDRNTSKTVRKLRQYDPNFLRYKLIKNAQKKDFQLTQQLVYFLEEIVHNEPYAQNSVALIDPYGNLLLAQADQFRVSPIHISTFNVIDKYCQVHSLLISDASEVELEGYRKSEAYQYMASLGDCTLIYLYAPSYDDFATLQTLGIIRWGTRGQINLKYIREPKKGSINDLQRFIKALPQFFQKSQKGKQIKFQCLRIGQNSSMFANSPSQTRHP